jgi:hypothetical protein
VGTPTTSEREPDRLVVARPADQLMRPDRLGAMKACRLSFVNSLVSRMIRNRWAIHAPQLDLDDEGRGTAVYRIEAEGEVFHSVVFSDVTGAHGTDRAWERKWDILVWLVEGDIDQGFIDHAAEQNAAIVAGRGRAGPNTLSWTRGNRSRRLFDYTVDRLASGLQPELNRLSEVGYLLRNVYYQANGMNGTRMFGAYPPGHPLRGVYHVQMLGLFLMREFSFDLVEAVARSRSAASAPLDPETKRALGVGNSSGIGLNLLVFRHPHLVSRWLEEREDRLVAAKRSRLEPGSRQVARLAEMLSRTVRHREQDRTEYHGVIPSGPALAAELEHLRSHLEEYLSTGAIKEQSTMHPFVDLATIADTECTTEAAESLDALLIDAALDNADGAGEQLCADETEEISSAMTVAELRDLVHEHSAWTLQAERPPDGADHWIWYYSAGGREPRMAARDAGHVEPDFNVVVDLASELGMLDDELAAAPPEQPVGVFAFERPRLRGLIAHVQSLADCRYDTVLANPLDRHYATFHLTRFVLCALKGMDKAFLMGDRWMRGVFLQGAPLSGELARGADEDWVLPETS